jgi:hypothetical protein
MVWINQHGTLPNPGSRFGSWNCAGGAQFGGKEGIVYNMYYITEK